MERLAVPLTSLRYLRTRRFPSCTMLGAEVPEGLTLRHGLSRKYSLRFPTRKKDSQEPWGLTLEEGVGSENRKLLGRFEKLKRRRRKFRIR